ncbi:TetR/AcrR family transcriptional regulator [Nocardia sp. NBC_00565]|uniref:TetR/AcrR family transcriptional regulator n=1 Tax=Nocardia sp. NBC_00565 TaxID=2975993 RepID=UPI002E808D8B|nr:TetR/AcrR family transcriptional regulator [Nocardia sp. NBC_00565]WUC04719.1 TetR/AcrR family transcriptional regulator [Nocardia sp. NBC_00565]
MPHDWLVGPSRSDSARERLYGVAGELIAERGVDRFDINELAARAHCSRATIYRHTGGKKQLVEAVFLRVSTRITDAIRRAVADSTGSERARTAFTVALREIRADPIARQFPQSRSVIDGAQIAVRSPAVSTIAADLLGLDPADTIHTALVIRSFLALLVWPPADRADEPHLIDTLATGLLLTKEHDARPHITGRNSPARQ